MALKLKLKFLRGCCGLVTIITQMVNVIKEGNRLSQNFKVQSVI